MSKHYCTIWNARRAIGTVAGFWNARRAIGTARKAIGTARKALRGPCIVRWQEILSPSCYPLLKKLSALSSRTAHSLRYDKH